MSPVDIILILLIVIALFFAIRYIVRQKRNGNPCIGCSSCGCEDKHCHHGESDEEIKGNKNL